MPAHLAGVAPPKDGAAGEGPADAEADGGLTMPEFWRLLQDIGVAHMVCRGVWMRVTLDGL